MAWSVTRHTQMPLEEGFKYLASNFESLDLGLFVDWKGNWEKLHLALQEMKEKALGNDGAPDQTPLGRKFIHLPSGLAPNYRYQLKFPEHRLYISITNPPKNSPNVYVRISAESLWLQGLGEAINQPFDDLREFHGEITKQLVSRCDLCADFSLPEPPTLDFLKAWMVSRSNSTRHYEKNGQLETFYAGQGGAKIQVRIYDKGKEILKSQKLWFSKIWGGGKHKHIWRVEFQLTRPALKDFGVDTVEDLCREAGGIWSYLTHNWFSLRNPENGRQNRREIHPWWQAVQAVAPQFGAAKEATRLGKDDLLQPAGWYVQHIAGMLPSFAARQGIRDLCDAIHELSNHVICYWYDKDFLAAYDKRLFRLGFAARFCPGGEKIRPAKSGSKCGEECGQKIRQKCCGQCTGGCKCQ